MVDGGGECLSRIGGEGLLYYWQRARADNFHRSHTVSYVMAVCSRIVIISVYLGLVLYDSTV